jgi:hypothetical protein
MTLDPGTREIRESASEVKFVVDPSTGSAIRDRVRDTLAPDAYAAGPFADQYQSTTIYFDTEDYAVYARRGSFRRAKYRIRRYGESDAVFLERKLRTSDSLSKRRTIVRIEDLPLVSADAPDTAWVGRWFHQRLMMRKLKPACQVRYLRTARVGMTDYGPIRLTIDEQLVSSPSDGLEFKSFDGAAPMTSSMIVEMKFRGPVPTAFKLIAEEFALEPVRVSKYRLALEATRPEVAAPHA